MKILIIEDNVTILTALKQAFQYKSVMVDHCANGREGYDRLTHKNYDLAVIDLELPGMRGEEIVKRTKRKGVGTSLLVLTSDRDVRTKVMLLEAGADDFMEKPYSFEELYARVMAIMRRNKIGFPSEYLVIEDLELLPEKRKAKRAGQEIDLRGKEYDLLKYFMSHPNQVISRTVLMEDVWGYSASTLSKTVYAYIFSLRAKLDKDSKKKLITTVHGAGYMLEGEP